MLGELMRYAAAASALPARTEKARRRRWLPRYYLTSGRAPSACIGAELCGLGKSGWAGAGELFVVESCEYRRSFLDLSPEAAVLLSVEPDHFDCFANFNDTREAFRQFAARVAPTGLLVVRGDSAAAVDAARASSARVETFSLEPGSDWRAVDVRPTTQGVRFSIAVRETSSWPTARCRFPASTTCSTRLAAIALCHAPRRVVGGAGRMARPLSEAFAGGSSTRGRGTASPRRRLRPPSDGNRGDTECRAGAFRPPEVVVRLPAAPNLAHAGPVPRVCGELGTSRRSALGAGLRRSRNARRECRIGRAGTGAGHSDAGGRVRLCADLDQIMRTLDDEARPGDVVMTMGAGDIDRVHHEFTRRLQRDRAS